jgi:hypothetical protein
MASHCWKSTLRSLKYRALVLEGNLRTSQQKETLYALTCLAGSSVLPHSRGPHANYHYESTTATFIP